MKNRSLTLVLLAGASVALGACVGTDAGMYRDPGLNPLSRYALRVEPDQDRIALSVRDGDLSANQRQALASLAGRYRNSAQEGIVIEVPQGNDPVALRSAGNIRAALESSGVASNSISLASYSAPDSRAPVLAGFRTVIASVPRCGAQWGNLSRTGENTVASNFGCAVNANLAAQIADPRDIVAPRAMTPPNAQRRTVVFEAYRQGQPTSAQREALLADSEVSQAVN